MIISDLLKVLGNSINSRSYHILLETTHTLIQRYKENDLCCER